MINKDMSDDIYKLLEEREDKFFKRIQMELEKATERITANLRLLLSENEKVLNTKIAEIEQKVNTVKYQCEELTRNCNKCENGMQSFKSEVRNKLEEINTVKNKAEGMGILMKIVIGSGLIGFLFMAGQLYNKITSSPIQTTTIEEHK